MSVSQGLNTRSLTFDGGSRYLPNISGKINRLTSQPHANKVNDKSCHSATKEKTSTVVKSEFLAPPSGMYI
jgi:hypothetical protein